MPLGINAAAAIMRGPLGVRLDPYLGCNFFVEIDSLLAGGFSKVRGLEGSLEVKEYAEGGENGYTHKIPGPTRYPNLVLSHGLTELDTLWSWYDDVAHGKIQRRDITIMLLDGRRTPVMWWDVKSAIPVKWLGPAFDAGSGEVAIESIELVHKGIVKPVSSRSTAASRAAMRQVLR